MTISDIDGNIYHSITIGAQEWLIENLRTTKYSDGTAIPNLTVEADWVADSIGAYCWYNNDIANKSDYGALYNWYAVSKANGLAPYGWRVSNNIDWNTLISFLGGDAVAGGKLKEIGLSHWVAPNTGATDSYGFRILPGGFRSPVGFFNSMGTIASLWSSDQYNATKAWAYDLASSAAWIDSSSQTKSAGFTVRCVRDVVPLHFKNNTFKILMIAA